MNFKVLAMVLIGITFLFETFMEILSMKSVSRPIPENVKDIYDAESYKKWFSYDKEKARLYFFRHIVVYLVIFVVIGFDVYANLIQFLGIKGDYAAAISVLLIDFAISMIYAIPIAYVDNMKLEQKYGFNRMTMKTFVMDQMKDVIINIVILSGLCSLFILIHKALGNWLLVVFTGIMLAVVLLIVFLFPLFSRIYNKFEPLPEGELRNRLCELLNANGCSVRAINVSDGSKRSSKANAYFTGFGKMKTIVLFDTLLEQMTDDEIVAVFAHEMGHNKHKDTLRLNGMNVINVVIFVALAWALVSVPEIYSDFGFDGVNYGMAFILLSAVCLSFISPLLGLFIGAFSRKYEYAADRFAAENGYGEALISALKKLARNSFDRLNPHPLVVKLTYSHPTVSERIERIELIEKIEK